MCSSQLRILTGFICVLVLSLTACSGAHMAHEETLSEKNWGRSYESAKYNQIIDPEAANNNKPVTGITGNSAEGVVDSYERSFRESQHQEVVNIIKLQ